MPAIHIARNGRTLGTFSEEQIREGIARGQFTANDHFWTEGASAWRQLSELAAQWGMEIPLPPPVPPEGDGHEPAWERRREIGFFPAIFQTITGVLFRPGRTFANLKQKGGIGEPLFYYLMLETVLLTFLFSIQGVFIVSLVKQVFSNPGSFMPPGTPASVLPHPISIPGLSGALGYMLMGIYILINILSTIGMMGVLLFILAGIHHLFLKLLGGARRPYETTFRVFSYVQASTSVIIFLICGALFLLVFVLFRPQELYDPHHAKRMLMLGVGILLFAVFYFAALIWTLYCHIISLKAAHGTDLWRAALAVLLPIFICCGSFSFLYYLFIMAVLHAKQ